MDCAASEHVPSMYPPRTTKVPIGACSYGHITHLKYNKMCMPGRDERSQEGFQGGGGEVNPPTSTGVITPAGLRACQACFARDDSCTADLQYGHRSSLTLLWAADAFRHRTKLWKQTLGAQSRVAASTFTHGGREGEGRWLPFQCWPACNTPQYCGKAYSIPRPYSYDGATDHIRFRSSLVLCILVQSWSWTGAPQLEV